MQLKSESEALTLADRVAEASRLGEGHFRE